MRGTAGWWEFGSVFFKVLRKSVSFVVIFGTRQYPHVDAHPHSRFHQQAPCKKVRICSRKGAIWAIHRAFKIELMSAVFVCFWCRCVVCAKGILSSESSTGRSLKAMGQQFCLTLSTHSRKTTWNVNPCPSHSCTGQMTNHVRGATLHVA